MEPFTQDATRQNDKTMSQASIARIGSGANFQPNRLHILSPQPIRGTPRQLVLFPDKMDAKTEQLLIEIEKNPVIYDKSQREYKDVTKRKDIFNEIGERLNLTGKSICMLYNDFSIEEVSLDSVGKITERDITAYIKMTKYVDIALVDPVTI